MFNYTFNLAYLNTGYFYDTASENSPPISTILLPLRFSLTTKSLYFYSHSTRANKRGYLRPWVNICGTALVNQRYLCVLERALLSQAVKLAN